MEGHCETVCVGRGGRRAVEHFELAHVISCGQSAPETRQRGRQGPTTNVIGLKPHQTLESPGRFLAKD